MIIMKIIIIIIIIKIIIIIISKDLRFEVDIRTAYKVNEDLLDMNSEYFKAIAGHIVYQVENNWVGRPPWKVTDSRKNDV